MLPTCGRFHRSGERVVAGLVIVMCLVGPYFLARALSSQLAMSEAMTAPVPTAIQNGVDDCNAVPTLLLVGHFPLLEEPEFFCTLCSPAAG
jgi:hypothetical protein